MCGCGCGCEGFSVDVSEGEEEGVGIISISIPHTPQPFTHAPNPQLPTNSFSAMYCFGEIGIGKLRRRPKRIDFVSFKL